MVADVKLMCDNCRTFNKSAEDPSFIQCADKMERFARQVAEEVCLEAETIGLGASRHQMRC